MAVVRNEPATAEYDTGVHYLHRDGSRGGEQTTHSTSCDEIDSLGPTDDRLFKMLSVDNWCFKNAPLGFSVSLNLL